MVPACREGRMPENCVAVISTGLFRRLPISLARSTLKPWMPPSRRGMACGANVPSTAVLSGCWALASPGARVTATAAAAKTRPDSMDLPSRSLADGKDIAAILESPPAACQCYLQGIACLLPEQLGRLRSGAAGSDPFSAASERGTVACIGSDPTAAKSSHGQKHDPHRHLAKLVFWHQQKIPV